MELFNIASLKKTLFLYERELIRSKDWLFFFLLIWTVVIMALQVAEFLGYLETLEVFHTAYVVILAAYITHKELNRWIGLRMKIRHGEFFVVIWWGLLLGMLVAIQFSEATYHLPQEMITTSYHVLGAFIVAEISKAAKTYHAERKLNE
jgi:membrane protease YdiL (CAAX protease family)